MTFLPKHPVSRVVAVLWLLACLTILVLTLLQRDLYANERTALALMVLVYFLSFPLGHLGLLASNKIKLALYLHSGFEPSLLAECVYLWTITVILGYVQWFVILPWLLRQCGQVSGVLSNRGSARGEIYIREAQPKRSV